LQRDADNHYEWVVLVDGDLYQIKKFNQLAKQFSVKLTIICDIIHVLEDQRKAGKILTFDTQLRFWVSEKLSQILKGKSCLKASGIRRSATCRQLKDREPIDSCAQ